MYIDNIIKDIRAIMFDAKQASVRAYDNRRDVDRTFNLIEEGAEITLKSHEIISDGLVDASQALDRANEDFLNIEEMLRKLIEDIEMEALSAKVQSK